MLSSSARLAILPTCMLAERPLRPVMASLGIPHSGAKRGNSRNSTAMTGAPSSTMTPAVRAAWASGGLPTGICALTSAVSSPMSPTSMAAAVASDCEKKKFVSIVKKPRKKTTKMSRRARSSSVLSASRTTISVTPASRPSTVRCVTRVAPMAMASTPSSHHVPGSGLDATASQPRHSSTAAASTLHHHGRLPTCGRITQPITSNRNSVSRLSRGRASRRRRKPTGRAASCKRVPLSCDGRRPLSMWPAFPGTGAGGRHRWRARWCARAGATRSPGPADPPATPRR
jgi:hypothetical protein